MRRWLRFLFTGRLRAPSWEDRVAASRATAVKNLGAHEAHFGSSDGAHESKPVRSHARARSAKPVSRVSAGHFIGSGAVMFAAFVMLYAVMQNPTYAYTARYGTPPEKLYNAPAPRLADDDDSGFHEARIKYAVVHGDAVSEIRGMLRKAGMTVVSGTHRPHIVVTSRLVPRPQDGCDHPRIQFVILAPGHSRFDGSSTDWKSCSGAGKIVPTQFASDTPVFAKRIKAWVGS